MLADSGNGPPSDAALAALDAAICAAALAPKLSRLTPSAGRPKELAKQKGVLEALSMAVNCAVEFAGDATPLLARERRVREALDCARALERRAELVLLALRLGVPGHVAMPSHAESRLTCDQDELEVHLVCVGDSVAQIREKNSALPPHAAPRTTASDAGGLIAAEAVRVAILSSLSSRELDAQLRAVAGAVEQASASTHLNGLADKVEQRRLGDEGDEGSDEDENGDEGGDEDGFVQRQ
jgi:hypothetical protein